MKLYLVAIYDVRFKYHHRPIMVEDIKAAIRSIHDAFTDPKHPLSLHPEQYDLNLLGWIEQDDEKGVLNVEREQDVLLVGAEYVKQLKEDKHE